METIKSSAELKLAIVRLEAELEVEKKELKREAHNALESINPLTPIKSAIHKIKSVSEKGNILSEIVGIGTRLVAKRPITVKAGNIFKNIAAFLFQSGSTYSGSENKTTISNAIREKLDE